MDEKDEIQIFKVPTLQEEGKPAVIYGQYSFEWQRQYLGIPASAMRNSARVYYESRMIESHLISNPWIFLTVTPSVMYSREPEFLKRNRTVSAYRTCELYMITKLALETELDKKKLSDNVLSLWEKAHWQWQTQTYGVPSFNTETKDYEVKGSPVSNGIHIMKELIMILDANRPENQNLTPKNAESRHNLVTMMMNSMLYTLCEWITATEFYLSKLATFIALHTTKGH